ncbi:MAG: hypothetical protein FWD58_05000 [Firmicutes bacterium]|nr:hypothetical protein [Bacillota bacterium]
MRSLVRRYYDSKQLRIAVDFLCVIFGATCLAFSFPVTLLSAKYLALIIGIILMGIGVIDLAFNLTKIFILKSEIKSKKTVRANIQILEYKEIARNDGRGWTFLRNMYGYLIFAKVDDKIKKWVYLLKVVNSEEEEKLIIKKLQLGIVSIEYYPKSRIVLAVT